MDCKNLKLRLLFPTLGATTNQKNVRFDMLNGIFGSLWHKIYYLSPKSQKTRCDCCCCCCRCCCGQIKPQDNAAQFQQITHKRSRRHRRINANIIGISGWSSASASRATLRATLTLALTLTLRYSMRLLRPLIDPATPTPEPQCTSLLIRDQANPNPNPTLNLSLNSSLVLLLLVKPSFKCAWVLGLGWCLIMHTICLYRISVASLILITQ